MSNLDEHPLPTYTPGTMTATRTAFGEALAALGDLRPGLVVLDDEARACDFIRMAVPGSTILCPCDANQAVLLTAALAAVSGISYLRASRSETPVIYGPDEEFPIGGSRVIRHAPDDQVTLVAAGVTVHEALAAADLLADDGISARVIDAYSIKPIDAVTLCRAAADTERILTVEDHWPEGGLGDAVLDALAGTPALVRMLAVREMPAPATPAERLQRAGIDMLSIADAAADLVRCG